MGKAQKKLEGRTQQDRRRIRSQMGTLKSLTIQPRTRARYEKAKKRFYQYLDANSLELPTRLSLMDGLLCDYLEELWASGEGRALASDSLAGLQDSCPKLRGCLPGAWRLLKAWHANEIPNRAPPLPEKILCSLAGYFIFHESPGMALSLLLGFYSMLRTGELLGIRNADVTIDDRGSTAVISLGLTKGGKRTGASESVTVSVLEVVALASVWRVLRGAREAVETGEPQQAVREAAMSVAAMADRLIVDIQIGESTERAMVVEEVPVVGVAAATAAVTAAATAAAMAAVSATAGAVHGHGGPRGRHGQRRGGGGSGRGERRRGTAGESEIHFTPCEACPPCCPAMKSSLPAAPILVRQPDGSLAQGQPWGWVASPAPSTPADVEQSQDAAHAWLQFQSAQQALASSRKVMICILLSSIFLEITLSLAQRSIVYSLLYQAPWHVVVRMVNIVYGLLFYFLGFQAIRVGGLFSDASHQRESQRLQRALRRLALAALFGALVQPMLSCRPVSLTFMRVATFSQAKAFLTDVQRLAVASAALASHLDG
eukprot:s678_g21.t1